MSKELEALDYLLDSCNDYISHQIEGAFSRKELVMKRYNTIKQALEQKEQQAKELEQYKQGEKFNNEIANITNEHNIEIIKEQEKELEELKQTNFIVKENIEGILFCMVDDDEVCDLTATYIDDIKEEIEKLVGDDDE